MVEQRPFKALVVGSSPTQPTGNKALTTFLIIERTVPLEKKHCTNHCMADTLAGCRSHSNTVAGSGLFSTDRNCRVPASRKWFTTARWTQLELTCAVESRSAKSMALLSSRAKTDNGSPS